MTYTPEEAEEIKEQLFSQLETLPEDRREFLRQKITDMSPEDLEEFVQQNTAPAAEQKCIFCTIIEGKIPSYKIDEDSDNVAILEINPISKGHILVLPKKHADKVTESTQKLAQKIGEKIKLALNPKEIKLSPNQIMGHQILEIIPLFGGEKTRKKALDSELQDLQALLTKPEEKKVALTGVSPVPTEERDTAEQKEKVEKIEPASLPRLKPRIP